MKRVLAVCAAGIMALAGIVVGAQRESLASQVTAKERQELDCLKSGNMTEFCELAGGGFGVSGRARVGRQSRDGQERGQPRLEEYEMSEVKVVSLSKNSGLLLYKLNEKGISHGKPFAATV